MIDRSSKAQPTTLFQQMICAAGPMMGASGRGPDVAEAAAAAGVDPAEARRLFRDDNALAAAVVETICIRLTAHVTSRTAQQTAACAVQQYRTLVGAAMDWCLVHHDQTRVLLQHDLLGSRRMPYRRYIAALRKVGLNMLGRAKKAGRLAPGLSPEAAECATRAMCLGLLTLTLPRKPHSAPSPAARAAQMAACRAAMNRHLDSLFAAPGHPGGGVGPAAR